MSHAFKKTQGFNQALTPCPFCGNLPEWVEVPGNDFIMRCSSCHASTKKARWTPEEAAADWNAQEIADDHYSITEDTKIDEYLVAGIKNVLFDEYSNTDPFPVSNDGFLCSSAIIITDTLMLSLEPECAHILYDEICSYGSEYYSKRLADEGVEIRFSKSKWRKDHLLAVSFYCKGHMITISAYPKYDCLIVKQE